MFSWFFNRLDKFRQKLRPHIPFTMLNTILKNLDKTSRSILDVGCGKGQPMKYINRHKKYFTVGVDIFEPYINLCKEQQIHNEYILGDVRNLEFKNQSYDVVLCTEVLEHLTQEEGLIFLDKIEKIAIKQVIISTPVGHYKQDEYDGNIHQEHKSEWNPDSLKARGYKVIGIGLRNLGGKSGVQSPLPKLLHPLVDVVWVLAGPVVYFLPHIAGDMVCIKNIKQKNI